MRENQKGTNDDLTSSDTASEMKMKVAAKLSTKIILKYNKLRCKLNRKFHYRKFVMLTSLLSSPSNCDKNLSLNSFLFS